MYPVSVMVYHMIFETKKSCNPFKGTGCIVNLGVIQQFHVVWLLTGTQNKGIGNIERDHQH